MCLYGWYLGISFSVHSLPVDVMSSRVYVDAHITAGGEAEGCAVSVMTNFRTDVITTPSF